MRVTFDIIPRNLGARAALPRVRAFPHPPLADFGTSARSLGGDTEGYGAGWAWHVHGAARGRVALGRTGAFRIIPELILFCRSKTT